MDKAKLVIRSLFRLPIFFCILKTMEGIYICRITSSGKTEVLKLLVQSK